MKGLLRGHYRSLPFILVFFTALWLAPGMSLFAKNGFIARAQFTTAVTDREPDDSISEISNNATKALFFTEFINMTGSTAVHRWLYKDSVAAQVSFKINGPRWRVYSSKQIEDWMTGDWTMEIVIDDIPQVETYTLTVIDDTDQQPAYNPEPRTTDKHTTPGEILALQQLFPDTGVDSISMQGNNYACPPGEYFQWQKKTNNLWQYQMANNIFLTVYLDEHNLAQPYSTTKADCVIQTTHQLNQDRNELIIETTDSCMNTPMPVLSVTSLKRERDVLDLLIFADSMSHCRYRLTQ